MKKLKQLILKWLFGNKMPSYMKLLRENSDLTIKILEEINNHLETLEEHRKSLQDIKYFIEICYKYNIDIDKELAEMKIKPICHSYAEKLDERILKGKIVMAFSDPLDSLMPDYDESNEELKSNNYKYFTDKFTGYGIHTYYVCDTMEQFIEKWKEISKNPRGMWYWCLDDGVCFCCGACDPDDIHCIEEHARERKS